MKAIILVGGEGTRLRPLTYTTPKSLLPIVNQPFLERQLIWLAAHGVDEAVLSLGYLPDAFVAHFADDTFAGVRLRYAVEPEPLGTAGGIRFAADGIGERIVVCNGDVLTALDLTALVRFHEERGAEATIALTRVDDPSAFGVVPTTPDGRVLAFVEKPPPGRAPTDWINAGTYVLEPTVLARIPECLAVSIERRTFPRMLEEGAGLFAQHSDSYWIDIGTPEKYLRAHLDVLNGALGRPPVAGAHEREPGIWSQGDVSVHPAAALAPPLLVGRGASIGEGAQVYSAVLGAETVIEPGGRVSRSVLLPGSSVAEGGRIADSVLGAGARIEADAAVADKTLVGAGAVVASGVRLSGARVAVAEVAP